MKFLKDIFKLFKTSPEDNKTSSNHQLHKPLLENPKFQIMVVPHTNKAEHYCIEYRNGFSWKRLYRPHILFETRFWERYFPYMESNFDVAVDFAKQFKTYQEIVDYQNEVFADFDKKFNKKKSEEEELYKSRRKTWTN